MDLRKEMKYAQNVKTSAREIEILAKELLSLTWTINIYRNKEASVINLKDLGWTFEFNDRKRAAGLCSPREKKIFISKWLLIQNLDQANEWENTVRHELAHAIDFAMRGKSDHSNVWKAVARKVLCTAERCYTADQIAVKVKTKYTLVCPKDECDYTRASHKARPKNARSYPCCTTCYNKGAGYVRLEQVQNY